MRRHRPRATAEHGRRRIRSLIGRSLRAAGWLAVLFVGLSVAAVTGLRFIDPPVSSVMVLEPGPIGDIDHHWIDRRSIPVLVAHAVIAAEDQRFLSHHGIDVDAVNEALEDFRSGDDLRGASTVTQQVAKNLFLWNGRSFVRKGLEAWFALLIDAAWSKQRILEVYLNIAEFGPGVFGVEAAAMHFFGAPASGLNGYQAALLAGVLPSPKRMDAGNPGDYLVTRAREIQEQMRLLEERGHYRGLRW